MPKQKRKRAKKKNAPILPAMRLYRRIAAGFLMLTVILLVVVMYLATVKATVKVSTHEEALEREFIARIVEEPHSSEDIPGMIFEETLERSKIFEVKGDGDAIPAKAHGVVTIKNESTREQPLVATTRLLSEDGVLFRIIEGVTVPANASIDVEVAADEPGKLGEIDAGKFTIPGLNQARQEQVYAVSSQKMIGGTITKKIVSMDDLEKAHAELLKDIEIDQDTKWRSQISGQLDGVIIIKETLTKQSDTEPGKEASDFSVSTTVKLTGIYYDSARLKQIADIKLKEHISGGQVLSSSNLDDMQITYNRSSATEKTAHLDVAVEGKMVLKETAEILDKANLIGLTAEDAEAFLEDNPAIEDASVEITPSWVRSIPKLQDHIEIIITGAESQK